MKGLSTPEADMVKLLCEIPPSTCGGKLPPVPTPWTPEEQRAIDLLVANGRAAIVPCPHSCGANHVQITAEGLMAYRLDSAAKTR